MTDTPMRPPPRVVESADPSCQPTKAEMKLDFDAPETGGRRRSGGAAPE